MLILNGIQSYSDPRQETFRVAIDEIEKNFDELPPVSVANVQVGFPASCVDLGWLKDKILTFWREAYNDVTRDELCVLLRRELPYAVQRLKYLSVRLDVNVVRIVLKTKDDMGWYAYEFNVALNVPHLRLVK